MELYQQISEAIKIFDRYWRKKAESVPQKPITKGAPDAKIHRVAE